jgi:ribosomal protein S8
MIENIIKNVGILSLFFISIIAGCSAVSNIELESGYDFSSNHVITVYTISSGHSYLDNTFSRVLHIDLQSRGYKIINANKIVESNSDVITSKQHREVANILSQKEYMPPFDLILISKPKWDSTVFMSHLSEREIFDRKLISAKGMDILTVESDVAFFDPRLEKAIKSFNATDTTHIYIDEDDENYYPEFPWMVIARQLTENFKDIPICSVTGSFPSRIKIPISLWVDYSYRETFPRTWKDRLARRVLYANDILCSQFGIELVISSYKEWNSEFENSLKHTLKKLQNEETSAKDEIRFGITLNKKLKTNWKDKSHIGYAELDGRNAIITGQPSFPGLGFWNPLEEALTIVHEFGHICGSIHVEDPESIMYPSSGEFSYEFDEFNRRVIIESIRNRFE